MDIYWCNSIRVYFDVFPKVKAITPVPGGVGPMTIAILMKQIVEACELFQLNSKI